MRPLLQAVTAQYAILSGLFLQKNSATNTLGFFPYFVRVARYTPRLRGEYLNFKHSDVYTCVNYELLRDFNEFTVHR